MDIDLVSALIRVDAGRPWRQVEARLARSGRTLGWLPPIGPGDTIGELLTSGADALRATGHGGPVQSCVAVEATLDGRRERTPLVPRSAAGADFQHLILGAGGAHAPLTAAWLRIHPRPEGVHGLRARFTDAASAAPALAAILQRGATPTVAVLDLTPAGATWDLVFEGTEPLTGARHRIARRLLEAADAELGDGAAALARVEALSRAALDGPLPACLPWGAELDLEAPWSIVGRAADAVLERLPEAHIALAHPTGTGARLLVSGLDGQGHARALAAAMAAGARLRERGSLLDLTFAATVGSLAEPYRQGTP